MRIWLLAVRYMPHWCSNYRVRTAFLLTMPAGFGLTLVLFSHDILMAISPDEPCLKRLARTFSFLYSYFTVYLLLQILLFLIDLFFLLWKWSILKLLCRNAPVRTASSRWSRLHFGFSSFAAFGLRARMCSPRPSLQPPRGYGATASKRRRNRSKWRTLRRTMTAIQDGLFRHVFLGVPRDFHNLGWNITSKIVVEECFAPTRGDIDGGNQAGTLEKLYITL